MLVESKRTLPVGGWKCGFGTGGDGTGDGVVEVPAWHGRGRMLECEAFQGRLREHRCLKKKQIWGEGRVRWQRDRETPIRPPFSSWFCHTWMPSKPWGRLPDSGRLAALSSPPHPCPASEEHLWPPAPRLAFLAGIKDESLFLPFAFRRPIGAHLGPLLRGAECPAWAAFWLPIKSPRANLATCDSCPGLALSEPNPRLPPRPGRARKPTPPPSFWKYDVCVPGPATL